MPETQVVQEEYNNPTGYWSYEGSFKVFLVRNVPTHFVPDFVQIEQISDGQVVIVENGRIKQTIGGIQFYVDERPFAWGYKYLIKITDFEGNIIWKNRDYS